MSELGTFKLHLANIHNRLDKNIDGAVVLANKHGPIGVDIIDKLIPLLEDLDKRLNQLEQGNGSTPGPTPSPNPNAK